MGGLAWGVVLQQEWSSSWWRRLWMMVVVGERELVIGLVLRLWSL